MRVCKITGAGRKRCLCFAKLSCASRRRSKGRVRACNQEDAYNRKLRYSLIRQVVCCNGQQWAKGKTHANFEKGSSDGRSWVCDRHVMSHSRRPKPQAAKNRPKLRRWAKARPL